MFLGLWVSNLLSVPYPCHVVPAATRPKLQETAVSQHSGSAPNPEYPDGHHHVHNSVVRKLDIPKASRQSFWQCLSGLAFADISDQNWKPVSSESGRDVPCNKRSGHVPVLNGISEEENENCCGGFGGKIWDRSQSCKTLSKRPNWTMSWFLT